MEYIFTLDKIIPRVASLHAAKTAFKYLNQSITFGDLEQKTNQLAHYLLENGLSKGDRVGIFLPRSLEIPIAIYGTLKAGGVFVPLDANMPQSRLAHIVEHCQISFVIMSKNSRKKIDTLRTDVSNEIHTIGLDGKENTSSDKNVEWSEVFALEKNNAPKVNILANDLAYIMYTSGTTGNPKGIMHTHYSGLSYAKLSQRQYDVNSNDIIANHSPLHFDISTFGYFTSPLACATTIIISEAHTKFPVSLAQLIKKENITIWYSVPVALIQLSDLEITKSLNITTLRWIHYGGENYPPKKLKALMAIWPDAKYSNVYGPAEVNQCTHYTIPKDINDDAPIPIGHIWANTEMLILDDEDKPVPRGEIGKLLIHSATMMSGYWRNPKLTVEAFYLPNDERMKNFHKKYYRTGDLVKVDVKSGLLVFYGRGDRQIKTRGYRVELNEVESTLMVIEEVENAAVFAYKNEAFGLLIGASIVVKQGQSIDKLTIQNTLAESLPKYCIPETIEFVDSIKRTSAGKVDYKYLISQIENL